MKERFELRGRNSDAYHVKFTKKHWWSKWNIEMDGEYVKKISHRQKYPR